MSPTIPALLEPYLQLQPEGSLVLITYVRGVPPNWIVLWYLYRLLGRTPAKAGVHPGRLKPEVPGGHERETIRAAGTANNARQQAEAITRATSKQLSNAGPPTPVKLVDETSRPLPPRDAESLSFYASVDMDSISGQKMNVVLLSFMRDYKFWQVEGSKQLV